MEIHRHYKPSNLHLHQPADTAVYRSLDTNLDERIR